MMLFRISLLPAVVCAGLHLQSVKTLSSAAEISGAIERLEDSDISDLHGGESDGQDPAQIQSLVARISGGQLKAKSEPKKLSLPLTRNGHVLQHAGHALMKPADVACGVNCAKAERGEVDQVVVAEASDKGIKNNLSFGGSRMPANLTLPPLLKRRPSGLEQTPHHEGELESSVLTKTVGEEFSEEVAADTGAAGEKADGSETGRLTANPNYIDPEGKAPDNTVECGRVVPCEAGAIGSSATEDKDSCRDCPLPNKRIHRRKGEGRAHGRAFHGSKHRKSNCVEGAPKEDCDEVDTSNTEEANARLSEENDSKGTEGFVSSGTDGKLKSKVLVAHKKLESSSARSPLLPKTPAVPMQSAEEVPCTSSEDSPCPQPASSFEAVKEGGKHERLRQTTSQLLLPPFPVQELLPHAGGAIPAVSLLLNQAQERNPLCQCPLTYACHPNGDKLGKRGCSHLRQQDRDASCRCQPICTCSSKEEKKVEPGEDSAKRSLSEHHRKLGSEGHPNHEDNNTSLKALYSETADQVTLVREPLPLFAGAHVRGEPFNSDAIQPVQKPKLHAAIPPTFPHIIHRSSSAFPAPLAQLEELFLNVGGTLAHSHGVTDPLRAAAHGEAPAGDGLTHE